MSPRAACRLEQLGFTDVSDYAGGKMAWMGAGLPTEGSVPDDERIGALARPVALTCDVSTSIEQLRSRAAEGTFAIVLADGDVVVGVVALDQLPAQGATTAGDVMHPGPSTFRPSLPITESHEYVEKNDMDHLLITRPDGTYIGIVTRQQLAAQHPHMA
jgi:predicted transcriptional regulator